MSRLIETIRLENGTFHHLSNHQRRIDYSLNELYPSYNKFGLEKILMSNPFPKSGLYKCRVTYDHNNYFIEYEPYTIRPVRSLRMVESNEVAYSFKFRNREQINEIFLQRNGCDDVLIIKEDRVTDISYANIVFKKDNDWITPSDCLLKGTMRQQLIEEGKIKEQSIRVSDIKSFEKFKLINALLRWDNPEVDISNIV
jgi:4-amino-4-deoxychorismate lyase